MRRLPLILSFLLGVLVFTVVGTSFVQARDSVLVGPGPARPVGPMLTVGDRPTSASAGNLYLTSVSIDPNVSLTEWVSARLGLAGELQPASRLRPHGMPPETYAEVSRQLLDESAEVAKVVALRRAGYPIEVVNSGALVTAVLSDRPAHGTLKISDRITAVDGRPVATAADTGGAIRARAVGEPVALTINRGGSESTVTLTTTAGSQPAGQASVGISVATDTTVRGQPFEIDVKAGNLGGPSAGLMFTLAMLDTLTGDNLTHGQRVAGTGTISIDEKIGPIDGVKHKVKGAERVGAAHFLTSRDNVAEARAAASTVNVVEVNTLQEALDFLKTLPPAATAPTSLPVATALRPAA